MTDHEKDHTEEVLDTNSSGDSTDAVNSHEDRLLADPALEPELAHERDEGHVHEDVHKAAKHAPAKHEHHAAKHVKHVVKHVDEDGDDVPPGPFSRSKGTHTSEDNEEV
jgi:hypothetical protein